MALYDTELKILPRQICHFMANFQQGVVNSESSPSFAQFGAPDPNAPNLVTSTEGNATSTPSPVPSAIYDGGLSSTKETGVLLRIGNGGAGQIGLIGALANAFIQDWVAKGYKPFKVSSEWPSLSLCSHFLNFRLHGILET